MSRTGKLFAFEHFGAEPDPARVAKSLASGLPLSAVVGRANVMDAPIASAIGGRTLGPARVSGGDRVIRDR
jgi:4-aminobutyrate aminotransferase-like enzyme